MNVRKTRRIPFHSYVGKSDRVINISYHNIPSNVIILRIEYIFCLGREVISPKTTYVDRPSEGAVCTVFLSNLYVEDTNNFLHSEYFKPDVDIRDLRIVIGEADCELDRGLEKALRCMGAGEESKITLSQNNEEITVFVKLIKFDNPPPIFEWSDEKKLSAASTLKEKGTWATIGILDNENTSSAYRLFHQTKFVFIFQVINFSYYKGMSTRFIDLAKLLN